MGEESQIDVARLLAEETARMGEEKQKETEALQLQTSEKLKTRDSTIGQAKTAAEARTQLTADLGKLQSFISKQENTGKTASEKVRQAVTTLETSLHAEGAKLEDLNKTIAGIENDPAIVNILHEQALQSDSEEEFKKRLKRVIDIDPANDTQSAVDAKAELAMEKLETLAAFAQYLQNPNVVLDEAHYTGREKDYRGEMNNFGKNIQEELTRVRNLKNDADLKQVYRRLSHLYVNLSDPSDYVVGAREFKMFLKSRSE